MLALCFVDLKKAYDSVNRQKLWDALIHDLGIPTDLVLLIKNLYVNSRGVIKPKNFSDDFLTFLTSIGVKQGDGASPKLFSLFFDRVYRYIDDKMHKDIYTRQQARAYTIATLQLFMLAFADDIVLIAPSVELLQKLVSAFKQFCDCNDLVINIAKTEVMLINCTGQIYISRQ